MEHDSRNDAKVSLMKALVERGLEPMEVEHQGQQEVALVVFDQGNPYSEADGMRPEITGYMEEATRNWQHQGHLYIVMEGQSYPAQVGARGRSGASGEDFRSQEWETVNSQEEAEAAFERFWRRRDEFFTSMISERE